jgi:RNA ligase (TIGR02306 family)
MRNLATIQTIKALDPIPDADAIEVATVLGWHVVVKNGEFKVGDKVVYCEIDSVLPKDNPNFAFLWSSNWRVRTRRMRGQVSQGICFPLSILPHSLGYEYSAPDGEDVTDLLGIIKYEAPIPACLAGEMKGGFPSFVPKTDETRIQTLGGLLEKYSGLDCVATEKLDGTSCTMYLKDGELGVAGRNIEYLESESNTYWQMARKYNIEQVLRGIGANAALQGEIIGDGIQGNKYKLPKNERQFYVFNIYGIDKRQYLCQHSVDDMCDANDILHVPVVWRGNLVSDTDALVEMSKGASVLSPSTKREGIVIRPVHEIDDVSVGRVSFKAINPDFLLKYDE